MSETDDPPLEPASSSRTQETARYHAPFTLSVPVLVLTLASALAITALLEYIQQVSDKDTDGMPLWDNPRDLELTALTRYLPALVMLLVATLYEKLEFNTAVLAPYSKMFAGEVSETHMKLPLLACLPPVALYRALRAGYWGYALTGSAAMVGSLLTIVVSGLYIIEHPPELQSARLAVLETWNTSFHEGLSGDGGAAVAVSLGESINMSYPLFTYDQLALPRISPLVDQADPATNVTGFVTARLPVLRAELSCTEIDTAKMNITEGQGSVAKRSETEVRTTWYKYIDLRVPLPQDCLLGSAYGNESYINIPQIPASLEPDAGNVSYVAHYIDLHVGPSVGPFEETGTLYPSQPDNPPGCPSVLLMYAYFDAQDMSKSTWTAMSCSHKIQSIDATIRFSRLDLSVAEAPEIDESTATYLQSSPNGETAFWWRLQKSMDESLRLINESGVAPYLLEYDTSNIVPDVSNFFRMAFFGRTHLPFSVLRAQDAASKAKIFDHLHMFYRRYMAQYISANLRVPMDEATDQPIVEGTYTAAVGRATLVQNRTSKIILQSMLAFMFVCAALALGLNKYRRLVIWNPCTIMGVAVLFAGSKICESADQPASSTHHARPNSSSSSQDLDGHDHAGEAKSMHPSPLEVSGQPEQQIGESQEGLLGNRAGTSPARADTGGMRFRLGWWSGGVYKGKNRPASVAGGEEKPWRYGIDRVH